VGSIDGRGRHLNHPSLSDNEKEIIRDHIKMFPVQTSHYSRNHTNKNYFLNPDFSINAMYRLYKNYCSENDLFICSEFIYRKIFVEEFNLGFKKPNNDTCKQCDKYKILLKCSTDDLEKDQIAKEKDEHLKFADLAYKEKQKDKAASVINNTVLTVSFDLQK